MKFTYSFFLLLCSGLLFGRTVDIRTLVMKSDVILFIKSSPEITFQTPNDYTNEEYIRFRQIDTVLKNKSNLKKLTEHKFKILRNNEDFFPNDFFRERSCFVVETPLDVEKQHYGLYFLQKRNDTHVILAHIPSIEKEDEQIKVLYAALSLDNINSLPERYEKTMDYFISRNDLPDDAFIAFYEDYGLIRNGKFQLTDEQKEKVRISFLNGNEKYDELIKPYYPNEVKAYYLQEMTRIKEFEFHEWSDYWDFQQAYEKVMDTEYGYDPTETGDMKRELIENNISDEEKITIMEDLINFAKSNLTK